MLRSFALVLLAVMALGSTLSHAAETQVTVSVEQAPVRSKPSFVAPSVGTLKYGQRVTQIEVRQSWVHVKSTSPALEGWVKQGQVSTKDIALVAGGAKAGTSATSDELSLAGKGFDEATEKDYRKKRSNLNAGYELLNALEKKPVYAVSAEQCHPLLKQGGLSPEGQP